MTVGFDLGSEPVAARDAATVVLVRDGDEGLELFFVKRRADIRFMGGAYVFPGGKLDAEDSSPAVPADLDARACAERLCERDNPAARALFVAAARECVEESGVLLSDRALDRAALAALRHALDVDKRPLPGLLAAHGVALALSSLRPLSRWVTPRGETRRFDARFFIARAPEGAEASHDTRETVASAWLSPREALERARRGEIVLVPPTFRTVEQLRRARTADEALALAPANVPRLEPVVRPASETFVILLPDDPEHPEHSTHSTHNDQGFVTRFVYDNGAWTAVARSI